MRGKALPNGAFSTAFAQQRTERKKWRLNQGLVDGIVELVKRTQADAVADFGAGGGHYVQALRDAGVTTFGLDGIPDVETLTGHVVSYGDLTKPLRLRRKWDWILSIEVGEHIPKEHTKAFVANHARFASRGVIVSWGEPGQRGTGHVNCMRKKAVAELFAPHGLEVHKDLTKLLANHIKSSDVGLARRIQVLAFPASFKPESLSVGGL